MSNYPIRLIALDLDGTLLNSQKGISPRTREVLKSARERGIVTVVATGRTPQSAFQYSQQIGGGPVICCNGAALLDEAGAVIVSRDVPDAPLQHVLQSAREQRVRVECYTPGGIVIDHPLKHALMFYRWSRPNKTVYQALSALLRIWRVNRTRPVGNLVRWAARPDHPPVLKLMFTGAIADLSALADRVNREVPGVEVTSSDESNLEITKVGVTKGTALQQLAAHLRIPRQSILAFGDSGNDMEMLQYAGVGVAMGNAPDTVKAVADRVAPSCDEDGVARVVTELCLV